MIHLFTKHEANAAVPGFWRMLGATELQNMIAFLHTLKTRDVPVSAYSRVVIMTSAPRFGA